METTPTPDIIPVDAYKADPQLDAAVVHAMDNCKPKLESGTALSDAQSGSLEKTMKMMNIGQCQYKTSATAAKAIVGSFFPPVIGGAATTTATTQAAGCEQINIISNIMNQCTQQLSCMLNQVESTSSTNLAVFQEISVELGDVSASNIILKNTSMTNAKTINIAQSTVQSAIGATITTSLEDAIKQGMDISNESFSDKSSQKNMTNMLSNLQSVASNTTINQSVATTTNSIYVNQKIKLIARNITNSTLELTNENIIELISENYVYNALDQLFKTGAVVEAVKEITQEATTKSTGVKVEANLNEISSMFGSLAGLIGGGFATFLIIAVIVAALYYFIFIRGKTTKNRQRQRQRR